MHIPVIQLAVKKEINAQSSGEWEAEVFRVSYAAFLVQAQGFAANYPSVQTWSAMKAAKPKADPAVPFKVGLPVVPVIEQLEHTIPGFSDILQLEKIKFASYYFHLQESHIHDATRHAISLIFSSEPLHLHGNFGNMLLLSKLKAEKSTAFMVKIGDGNTICKYDIPDAESTQLMQACIA